MIIFNDVSKGYFIKGGSVKWVLRNFSLKFPNGSRIGILAQPGSGKTTLINLVAGSEVPSSGNIIRGKGAVSWPLPSRNVMNLKSSTKQNVRFLSDIYGRDYERILDFISEFTGLKKSLDQPMRQLSPEARYKVTISTFLAMDFAHYLIDDDFEAGDRSFRQKINDFIVERRGKISMFIATSNTILLENHCEIGGVLHDGTVTFYPTVKEAINSYHMYDSKSAFG